MYERIEINPVIKFINNLLNIKEIMEITKEIIFRIKIFIEKNKNFFNEKLLMFFLFLLGSYKIIKILVIEEKEDSFVYNFCIGSFAFAMGLFSYTSFFHFLTYKMNLMNFLNSFSVTYYWIILFIMVSTHFFSLKCLYNNQKIKWLKKDYKRYLLIIPEILLIYFPFNHLLFVVN